MRKNLLKLCAVSSVVIVTSCSTPYSPTSKEVEERGRKVRDRNPAVAQEWVENFEAWEEKQKKDSTTENSYHYEKGESGEVSDRILGCEVAEAEGRNKIAKKVGSLVMSTLDAYKAGELFVDPLNPNSNELRQQAEMRITQIAKAFIRGSSRKGTFWEEHDYSASGGKKRLFICQVVVQIKSQDLDQAIREAAKNAPEAFSDPGKKEAARATLAEKQLDAKEKWQK